MKPIQINFAENRQWRWIWMFAVLVCLTMISAVAWYGLEVRQELQRKRQDIEDMQVKLQQLKVPAVVKPDLRQQSKVQAAKLLNMDLNWMFVAVENLKLPGVRLTSIAFDAGTNRLRLDYDVDTLAKAAQVTELLNAGDESRPWKMERVVANAASTSAGTGPFGGGASQTPQSAGFKAVWTQRHEK